MSTSGSSALALAKHGYVRTIRRLLPKTRLEKAAPGKSAGHVRQWWNSLPAIYDSAELARLDLPWWTFGAIDFVDDWLSRRPRPTRVFEYGAGASTVWLARRVSEVYSVEHHEGFATSLPALLKGFDNVRLRCLPPEESADPQVGSRKEGHAGLDFSSYVHAIDDVPGQFDVIVIDGRAREACLAKARQRLAPGGIIVFDNSRRRRYRSSIEASGLREKSFRGLTPTLPYPEQTSVLRLP